jgi:2-polyprenyl-6-methoxyphenol hydroxylase-like FAD-dependent oxidoreductase
MSRIDVGVIGGGTAGAAAALLLARAGHRVSLYERVPEPGPVGAGIVLQPTGIAVLARLGLAAGVVGRGAPLSGLRVTTPGGREVVALEYDGGRHALHGVGLHRGTLFEALWGQLAPAGVRVATGVDVVRVRRARGGGRWLDDAGGRAHGPHELTVVADGARSRLAEQIAPWRRRREYPWGAMWFVGVDEDDRFAGRLEQVVRGAQRMLGLLPTGRGPRGADLDGDPATERPLVSLYWSVRHDRVDEVRRDLAGWKRVVEAWVPAAGALLGQIRAPEELVFTAYQDVTMWPWDDGDAVVLGDAAHAMSPQLGQGANLALWDAMVLADCLAQAPSIPEALDAYSRARRDHLDWFQFATRWLTPFFQGDWTLLGLLRDAGMPLAARIGFVRRLMVASMTGVALGPFRTLRLP